MKGLRKLVAAKTDRNKVMLSVKREVARRDAEGRIDKSADLVPSITYKVLLDQSPCTSSETLSTFKCLMAGRKCMTTTQS